MTYPLVTVTGVRGESWAEGARRTELAPSDATDQEALLAVLGGGLADLYALSSVANLVTLAGYSNLDNLTDLLAVTNEANKILEFNGTGFTKRSTGTAGLNILAASAYGDVRTLLTLEYATQAEAEGFTESFKVMSPLRTSQAIDEKLAGALAALKALTLAADKLIYATDEDSFATSTLTSFARSLLDDADAATFMGTLGMSANARSFVTAADYAAMRTALSVYSASEVDTAIAAEATARDSAISTAVAAEASARDAAIESAGTTKVDKSTTIDVAGLAVGGGDLSAGRTINVPEATALEAAAGTAVRAMSARRVTDHFNARVSEWLRENFLSAASQSAARDAIGAVSAADIDAAIAEFANAAPETLAALEAIRDLLALDPDAETAVLDEIATRVPIADLGTTGFVVGDGEVERSLSDRFDRAVMLEDFTGDVATKLTKALAAANSAKVPVVLKGGETYSLSSASFDDLTYVDIRGVGSEPAIIECTTESSYSEGLKFGESRTPVLSTTPSANLRIGKKKIPLASVEGVQAGDLLVLRSNKVWYHDPRYDSPWTADNSAGTVVAATGTTIQLESDAPSESVVGSHISINGGTGSGQARTVTAWDGVTKTATVDPPWKTTPDTTSTYIVPEARKGETHRIRRVGADHVWIEMPLFDGYDTIDDANGDGLESVTVDIYRPVRLNMENLHIRCTESVEKNNMAVRVHYAMSPRFRNVTVERGRQTGLGLFYSYGAVIEDFEGIDSNDISAGYAIQTQGCTDVTIIRPRGWNSKRIIDISGMDVPSREITISGVRSFGGDVREDGDGYWPEGAVESRSVGSHSPAENIRWKDCVVGGTRYGWNIRGRNTYLTDCWVVGECLYPFEATLGANVYMENCGYWDGRGELPAGAPKDARDFDSTFERPIAFFYLSEGFTGDKHLRRISAQGIRSNFIETSASVANPIDSLVLEDLDLRIVGASFTSHALIHGNSSLAISLTNPRIGRVDAKLDDPADSFYLLSTQADLAEGSTAQLNHKRRFTVQLADDAYATLPLGMRRSSILPVVAYATDSVSYRANGLLTKGSTTFTDLGGSLNAVAGSSPSSSAGDGNLVLVLPSAGNWLYIRNRTGAARTFVVEYPMTL